MDEVTNTLREILPEHKKTMLEKSNVFCMAPWIHMHIWPNGNVMPCCVTNANIKDKLGNTHQNTLKEIWNSDNMKQLRLDMLNDKPNSYCTNCYKVEQLNTSSLRNSLNDQYGNNHFDKVLKTQDNGSHDEAKFVYMDIRFSNICNLKCRTCSPTWSSLWYDDYKKAHGEVPDVIANKKYMKITDKDKILEEVVSLIDVTEGVYWAGGEPFITEEHWHIMDHWVKTDRAKDISINYTTNFSQLNYKNRDLFDLWKHFKNVSIHASLDGSWERGEYIRKGLNWEKVIANRKLMLEHCPDIQFEITPTVSILNVLNLADFHREWLEQGLLSEPNLFRFNWLFYPEEFCIQNLPYEYKNLVVDKWKEHKQWLISNYDPNQLQNILSWIDGLVEYIHEDYNENNKLIETLEKYDVIRNESWRTIFPELDKVL
tara:strand:- start:3107 stop:4390 length:1284 start_codon:yes stop_codon:yes gene_type:complete